jgi:hypothetical protein
MSDRALPPLANRPCLQEWLHFEACRERNEQAWDAGKEGTNEDIEYVTKESYWDPYWNMMQQEARKLDGGGHEGTHAEVYARLKMLLSNAQEESE